MIGRTSLSADVHVVGAGLIGTSIGLALAAEQDVVLSDHDPKALEEAVERGAGRRWTPGQRARLLVAAVPPSGVAAVIAAAQRTDLATTYSHVSSVQSQVQAEIAATAMVPSLVCGGHPLAGRERAGPASASSQLFVNRPWVVCPGHATSAAAQTAVEALARGCGATPHVISAREHDAAVALVSHLPQVAASGVAAMLLRAPDHGRLRSTELAGPGIQDTTRIAASAVKLWADVLGQNATFVAPLVATLADDLAAVGRALQRLADAGAAPADATSRQALDAVRDLLERGNAGRALLPLKSGTQDVRLVTVSVSVPDQPGQLAGVLKAAAAAEVNVEDVRVEHLPGRPRGVLELVVRADAAQRARETLRAAGWDVLA